MLIFLPLFACFREACERALIHYYAIEDSQVENISEEIANGHLQQLGHLEEVFNKAAQADQPTEVRLQINFSRQHLLSFYKTGKLVTVTS